MRALSLWQPWASLWCSERKLHETRGWYTSHRGWLLVHAAKKFVRAIAPDDPLRAILDDEFGGHWGMDLPTGALIGAVDVVACEKTERVYDLRHDGCDDFACGDFYPGRFAWRRDAFQLFNRPIPYRGAQRLFAVPDDVLTAYGYHVPAREASRG